MKLLYSYQMYALCTSSRYVIIFFVHTARSPLDLFCSFERANKRVTFHFDF